MFFRAPGEERLRSLPASWTDVEGPDPFVALAGGRACLRVADLRTLAALLRALAGAGRQAHSAVSVMRNTPDVRGAGHYGSNVNAR